MSRTIRWLPILVVLPACTSANLVGDWAGTVEICAVQGENFNWERLGEEGDIPQDLDDACNRSGYSEGQPPRPWFDLELLVTDVNQWVDGLIAGAVSVRDGRISGQNGNPSRVPWPGQHSEYNKIPVVGSWSKVCFDTLTPCEGEFQAFLEVELDEGFFLYLGGSRGPSNLTSRENVTIDNWQDRWNFDWVDEKYERRVPYCLVTTIPIESFSEVVGGEFPNGWPCKVSLERDSQ